MNFWVLSSVPVHHQFNYVRRVKNAVKTFEKFVPVHQQLSHPAISVTLEMQPQFESFKLKHFYYLCFYLFWSCKKIPPPHIPSLLSSWFPQNLPCGWPRDVSDQRKLRTHPASGHVLSTVATLGSSAERKKSGENRHFIPCHHILRRIS